MGAKSRRSSAPVVAVTSLDAREGVTPGEAAVIADNLATQLQRSGAFRVMERSQMDQILREQNFQQTGACDGGMCAVEMGKVLGIDRMVVGSLGRVGTVYSLNLRLVDVASGEILRTSACNRKGAIEDVLTDLVPMAVSDLTESDRTEQVASAPAPAPSSPAPAAPAPGKSGDHKIGAWPWIVGGVVVLAGAGAAYVLLNKKSDTSTINPIIDGPVGQQIQVQLP